MITFFNFLAYLDFVINGSIYSFDHLLKSSIYYLEIDWLVCMIFIFEIFLNFQISMNHNPFSSYTKFTNNKKCTRILIVSYIKTR